MTLRTWTCAACARTFETLRPMPRPLTRQLCGRCRAQGREMTAVAVAKRKREQEAAKRWEAQKRKLLGLA